MTEPKKSDISALQQNNAPSVLNGVAPHQKDPSVVVDLTAENARVQVAKLKWEGVWRPILLESLGGIRSGCSFLLVFFIFIAAVGWSIYVVSMASPPTAALDVAKKIMEAFVPLLSGFAGFVLRGAVSDQKEPPRLSS